MVGSDAQPRSGDGELVPSDRILTVPNFLSCLRLLLIPLFVWLALGPEADGWAFAVLAVSAVTDFLDGKIARHYQIVTRVGQLLDPIADRLYVVSTILVLAIRDVVPWWLVAALVARDVFMLGVQLVMRRHQLPPIPVHYVGKAATVCLLFALPMWMLTTGEGALADVVRPVAWAFGLWGLAIYWWAALLYAEQANAIVNGRRSEVTA